MESENETVSDIVKRVRRDCNSYPLPTAADKMLKLVREIEAAHKREVAELERKVSELRECLKETMADAVAEYKNNSCFRNVKCGEIERCGTCKVMKWRKALRENERLAYEREAKDGK